MAQTSVSQFASQLRMPAGSLLEQLQKAGVAKKHLDDVLSEQDKSRLLEYLRRSHGPVEAKTKITLTRKETSEIRQQDSHGKSHTVQVEVRKKRVLVKRDVADASARQAPPEVAEIAAPLVEPVVEPVVEHVVEAEPVPVPAPPVRAAEREPEPLAEVAAPVAEEPKVETVAAEVRPGAKKVVTRASIIGEEQQRLRAEEERRHAELRARQEAEFKSKQQRSADLVRLKQEAEEKAVAAKAAGAAKVAAAQTASDRRPRTRPAQAGCESGDDRQEGGRQEATGEEGGRQEGAVEERRREQAPRPEDPRCYWWYRLA